MNVKNAEKKEKNVVEVVVEFDAAEFDAAINDAYRKNKNSIAIPGFRKGKAPRKIIENMYGASIFYEDALGELYPKGYSYAVEQENLRTVGQPSVKDMNVGDDKTVSVTYAISLYPEVTMGEYKGVSAVKPSTRVNASEVDKEIESVRQRNARIQPAERAAKKDDIANIDFEGFLDGTPFDGGKGEGQDLTLGSGMFVPGFEEQVIGMKAGEEKDINVTFPEDYTPELAGKAVVFKVKVNEVKEKLLPELDDEFAKDVSEFDTFDEYRASVKEKLSENKKNQAKTDFQKAVMDKVIDGMQCEVPDAMVDEQIDSTIQQHDYNLAAQGLSFAQYLKMMGMEMSTFRASMRDSAEKQIKMDLALEKISELENITPSDEDIEAEYKKIAESYDMDVEEIKKGISVESVSAELKREKAAALVYDSAVEEKKSSRKEGKKAAEPEKAAE